MTAESAVAEAPIASTGGATSVKKTSVMLQGVVSVNGVETAWTFQWGRTTAYGHNTPVKVIASGSGVVAVATTIRGLAAGTTYHFRLLVSQGSYPSQWSVGGDFSFRSHGKQRPSAAGHARASLKSHRLAVHSGAVSVPLVCTGTIATNCAGIVLVAAQSEVGGHPRTVICGGGTFSMAAGASYEVQADLAPRCASLLRTSPGHVIRALLAGSFSTGQAALRTTVTLARG
jgi:hypothetical protein